MNKSRILLALLLIVGAGAAVAGGTSAFFSDTETSAGNIFTAGEIDLLVDNSSYYNGNFCDDGVWVGESAFPIAGTPCDTSWALDNLNDGEVTAHRFFNFNDVKPDDEGEDTISLHVQNDAWMCLDVTLTSNDDNGNNDPELDVDGEVVDDPENDWDGELAQQIQMFWWADDGDNVLETDETNGGEGISGGIKTLFDLASTSGSFSVALADANNNVWGEADGTPVPAAEGDEASAYIAKAWCFGTLALNPVTAGQGVDPSVASGITCDGELLGNLAQTDTATLDVEFRAVQARNNPSFLCEEPPTFGQCEVPTLAFADNVVSSSQGVRKNGTPVLANRSNTASVLGPNQSSGLPSDPAVPAGSFFSLGFKNNGATDGGSIVVEFTNNVIVDGPGNDLQVWEVTGGVYPDEFVKVEVSQDNVTWHTVAASLSRDAQADIASSGLAWAKYIRLTDVTPIGPFEQEADAYDLDAFSALHCGVPLVQ